MIEQKYEINIKQKDVKGSITGLLVPGSWLLGAAVGDAWCSNTCDGLFLAHPDGRRGN